MKGQGDRAAPCLALGPPRRLREEPSQLLADSMPGLGSIVLAAVLFPGALILALLVAGIRRLARWQGVLWLLGEILAGVAVIAMTIVALVNVNDLWRIPGAVPICSGISGAHCS
jgi:hypothetical protein